MAQKPDPLALIRKRKVEMEAQRAAENAERERLDAAAALRAREEEELAIAERVLARLATAEQSLEADRGEAPKARPAAAASAQNRALKKIPAAHGSPRPEGIPSVAKMVTNLLTDAERRGLRGLTPAEIMIGIDAHWWPGVAVNLVMPTVYRNIQRKYWFAKEGNLIVRLRGGQPPRHNLFGRVDPEPIN